VYYLAAVSDIENSRHLAETISSGVWMANVGQSETEFQHPALTPVETLALALMDFFSSASDKPFAVINLINPGGMTIHCVPDCP
jgi:hypothetical protein